MVATFNPALTDNISKVRLNIGDTDIDKADIQDETIEALLATPLSVLRTSAKLAYNLAAKYARLGDVTVDDQRNNFSKISEAFRVTAERLTAEADDEDAEITTPADVTTSMVSVTGLDDYRGPLQDCPPGYYPSPRCC